MVFFTNFEAITVTVATSEVVVLLLEFRQHKPFSAKLVSQANSFFWLSGTDGHRALVIDQIRSDQIRSDQIRSGQIKSQQITSKALL